MGPGAEVSSGMATSYEGQFAATLSFFNLHFSFVSFFLGEQKETRRRNRGPTKLTLIFFFYVSLIY